MLKIIEFKKKLNYTRIVKSSKFHYLKLDYFENNLQFYDNHPKIENEVILEHTLGLNDFLSLSSR